MPVQRGDRDRVAEAEPVELERLEVAARVVELVREDEHRAARRAEDLRELLVAGRDPRLASTTKRTRSASSTASRACAAICGPNGPVSARSTPPVSMSRNVVPDHSQRSSLRSRVTPGVSWTTAVRVAVRRLISVDLPTFGKPTIATVPAISTSVGARLGPS